MQKVTVSESSRTLKTLVELCLEEELYEKALFLLIHAVTTNYSTTFPACYVQLCATMLVHPSFDGNTKVLESCRILLRHSLALPADVQYSAWSLTYKTEGYHAAKDTSIKLMQTESLFRQPVSFWDLIRYVSAIPPDFDRWMSLLEHWSTVLKMDNDDSFRLLSEYVGTDEDQIKDTCSAVFSRCTERKDPSFPFAHTIHRTSPEKKNMVFLDHPTEHQLSRLWKLICFVLKLIWDMIRSTSKPMPPLDFLLHLHTSFEKLDVASQTKVYENLGHCSLRYSLVQYVINDSVVNAVPTTLNYKLPIKTFKTIIENCGTIKTRCSKTNLSIACKFLLLEYLLESKITGSVASELSSSLKKSIKERNKDSNWREDAREYVQSEKNLYKLAQCLDHIANIAKKRRPTVTIASMFARKRNGK
ncbi:Smc5-6 complex non-SMC subunit Nse5 [Schizosaccharomyces japonicus yFS275]|uniref:Smc5-6 complex non-SMC subunit Nse5 n=1 Tax=Schizosaccharomyces japonicus (strain yFS275 / FY16936) TaxID=402676 RepID=B6K855_SCHJY|nr:Smc5-6 complex non-SMC subunit Nse5 [Schizosaccharomyces japonicus yFS275]EEB09709.1 Smc5-6 complex non-SMC subunit Nse5 [Schizosaccharomyces japonicus yFS275]